jgi:hypothetical protein
MKINRARLRETLAKKGLNQVYIDEIDECIRITQVLDQFKRDNGLPSRDDWEEYQRKLKIA